MSTTKRSDCERAVSPLQRTLSPLERPYFDLDAIDGAFSRETGSTLSNVQATILDVLRERQFTFDDALFDSPSTGEPLIDHAIVRQIGAVEDRLHQIADKAIMGRPPLGSPYGVVSDDLYHSHRLRLRLDQLAQAAGQEALRSITVVHSFIPAELLEGPGPLGFSPEQMVAEFYYDVWRALAEAGFSFVRLVGWLELELIDFSKGHQNKADCLADWWLYRGRDFFQISDPPKRCYSLHLHAYGLARIAGRWAIARNKNNDLSKALKAFFPSRNAVLCREFDLTNSVEENIGRIGRYRSKLMGDVEQGRSIPSPKEIAANVRIWSRCATQSRDFTIVEDWPEIGARRPKPLDDPDLMKRVSDAWNDAERAWTPQSPFLRSDVEA
jgi:hypothetical protein